jgi:hypothetical protein
MYTRKQTTVRSESHCALRLRYVDLVVSIEIAVKQRLKCNTGKVCNCVIQFLLTIVHENRIQHFLYVHSDFPNALYLPVQLSDAVALV